MNKYALTVENLTKVFSDYKTKKENTALNNLSFKVKQGEVFGLLGPNGAGKTTFLGILGGTVAKTKGSVNVWGFDIDKNPRQVKASIGIVPQEVNLDAFFSPRKLLELQAGLYGVTKKNRITDLILKMVSLEDKANAYSRSLSGGMKRRLLIAKAMVHQPPILILDEPTNHIDIQGKEELKAQIIESNATVLITSHDRSFVDNIAERYVVIKNGKLTEIKERNDPEAHQEDLLEIRFLLMRRGFAMDMACVCTHTVHQLLVNHLVDKAWEPPPDGRYERPTLDMLAKADKKFWRLVAKRCRSGIRVNSDGVLDKAVTETLVDPQWTALLAPLPPDRSLLFWNWAAGSSSESESDSAGLLLLEDLDGCFLRRFEEKSTSKP